MNRELELAVFSKDADKNFDDVPFNRPSIGGNELSYIAQALNSKHLSGDGKFTRQCNAWLERATGCSKALLTHSCTAALEMTAMLIDLKPGDEVIMPSFTFVSTANAVVLRGAVPVFIDIRPDTLNIDESLIEAAITKRTRAIFVVHYAGVSCAMDVIMEIADRHGLYVVEDAAQGVGATYRNRPLGGIGHFGCFSFHETKNVISGEGGALLINRPSFIDRAHVLREKGTNRTAFFQGQVDKYTWMDLGSSYLPSEILAAFLFAQLEIAEDLLSQRRRVWMRYHLAFEDLEAEGLLRRPVIPTECDANSHIYFIVVESPEVRTRVLAACHASGIGATFHYVPLHSAPAGVLYGRTHGSLSVTDDLSSRLIRLPLWSGITDHMADNVINVVKRCF